MTRFREEVYAARWYKALVRRTNRAEAASEANSGASRSQYFQKPLSVRKAIEKGKKAQRRLM